MAYKSSIEIIEGFKKWVKSTPEGRRAFEAVPGVSTVDNCDASTPENVKHFLGWITREYLDLIVHGRRNDIPDEVWDPEDDSQYSLAYTMVAMAKYLYYTSGEGYNDN